MENVERSEIRLWRRIWSMGKVKINFKILSKEDHIALAAEAEEKIS